MGAEKHWYWDWGTYFSSKNDAFACMVIVTYKLPCAHIKDTNRHRQNHCFWFLFLVSRGAPRQTIFTYSDGQNGLVRARHTNLSGLASENMWSPPIFIELLTVLILLQPHMHFSSSTSRHFSREETWVMETHFTTQWNVELVKKRGSQNTKNPQKRLMEPRLCLG